MEGSEWVKILSDVFGIINFLIIVFFLPFIASQRRHREKAEGERDALRRCFQKEIREHAEHMDGKLDAINKRIDQILQGPIPQDYWRHKGH